jgi:3D (Asp-Asp-Asp) domain-containing protein
MRTKGQFILFTVEEFDHWLRHTEFSREIRRIQNHHTWKPSYAQFDGSNHFARLEAMRDFHVNHNGWNDIGQNITTFPDGIVAICRSFETTPACIFGVNSGAICIEHLGNFDDGEDVMTEAQQRCAVRVNALLCSEFNLSPNTETIVYHHWYDLDTGERNDGRRNNKSCPGTNFFGGNKVEDCEANFLPLVRAALDGGELVPDRPVETDRPVEIVPLRKAVVESPDGRLNVRTGASATAEKVDELAHGAAVSIFEITRGWCRIDPGKQRWVSERFLVISEAAGNAAPGEQGAGALGRLEFDLPEPKANELQSRTDLWGTFYYAQAAQEVAGGIPLRNKRDEVIGPSVSQRNWCLGAMEGTITVEDARGNAVTYNFEATGATAQTSCRAFFPNLNPAILAGTERVRWHRAKGPFGDGAGGFILSPYRSLAVDRRQIPLGTAIYIPEARGTALTLPDGSAAQHDGYFFAADVGGAIKGNHVDFFLGPTSRNPFPFVKSRPQNTFVAHHALNAAVRDYLRKLHTA